MLLGNHDQVVSAIRKALTSSAASEGGAKVELKLSNPFMENMTSYSYETNDNTTVGVYERVVESPYIFSVPAQVRECLQTMSCIFFFSEIKVI